MTFIVLLFMLLLYCILSNKEYKKSANIYISIITIILIFISGARNETVGNDTIAYIGIYEQNEDITWHQVFEDFFIRFISPSGHDAKDPGYLVFMKILHTCQIDSRTFLFVVAAMLLIPLGIFIYQNSDNLKTVLFSYCFYMTLFYGYLPNSAVRQSLALSFILWSYIFWGKRKLLVGIFLIIIGAMIHKSALIALLIILCLRLKNIFLIYKLMLIPFMIILLFPEQIAQLLADGNDVYSGYASSTYYSNKGKPYLILLLIGFFYVLGWIFIKNFNTKLTTNKYKILFLGCSFTFLLVPLVWANPNALRIISYFGPCMAIVVGMSLSKMKNLKRLFPILLLLFLYLSVSKKDNYLFMWQQEVNFEVRG